MKIIKRTYIGKGAVEDNPFPARIIFDNGNSRVVRNFKDYNLLIDLLYKKLNGK